VQYKPRTQCCATTFGIGIYNHQQQKRSFPVKQNLFAGTGIQEPQVIPGRFDRKHQKIVINIAYRKVQGTRNFNKRRFRVGFDRIEWKDQQAEPIVLSP
jgi:hypothetical protein